MKSRTLLLSVVLVVSAIPPILRGEVRSFGQNGGPGKVNSINKDSGEKGVPPEYSSCNNNPPNVLFSPGFTSDFAYCPSESSSDPELFGLEWEGTDIYLYKMGSTSGCAVGQRVGSQPVGGANLESLAYCPSDGFFYTASFNFGAHVGRFVRIDRQTGVGTPVGDPLPTDLRIVGMTYDPVSGEFYAYGAGHTSQDAGLWRITRAGVATLIGRTGAPPVEIQSLTLVDDSNAVLAVVDPSFRSLATSTSLIAGGTDLWGLNMTTGTATVIGGNYGDETQWAMAAPTPSLEEGTDVYFSQTVRGNENTTRILIWNTSAASASVKVEFFDQSGINQETRNVTVGVDATSEVVLGGPGVALTVGWVRVTSGQTVQVSAFLSLVGVPQVGVLSAKVANQWSGVGEVNDLARTGVAAANPGSGTANCTLTVYNLSGTKVGEAPITLGPGNQIAQFLDELIANLPTPYEGCFSLTWQGGSVVSVALRQRLSDAVFTTVAMDRPPGSTQVYFPQAVRGDSNNTTRILVWNSGSTTAAVTIEFINQDGVIQETQNRTVGSKATAEVVLTGAGLAVGSAKVSSSVAILATAFFSILGGPRVGVLPVTGAGWWSGVGEVSTLAKTGVAAANAGPGTASCTLTAYNTNGSMAGEAPITLGSGKQVAKFLDELIATLPSSYQGCFSLHCDGASVVAVALRQRTSDAALATVAMAPIQEE